MTLSVPRTLTTLLLVAALAGLSASPAVATAVAGSATGAAAAAKKKSKKKATKKATSCKPVKRKASKKRSSSKKSSSVKGRVSKAKKKKSAKKAAKCKKTKKATPKPPPLPGAGGAGASGAGGGSGGVVSQPPAVTRTLAVSTPQDFLGVGSRLVFSAVAGTPRAPYGTQSVTLTNTGSASVTVSGADISGTHAAEFATCSSTSFAIASGASATICVRYQPANTRHVSSATLSISTDTTVGLYSVALGGLNIVQEEAPAGIAPGREPDLQNVFDALGYGVDAGVVGASGNPLFVGDTDAPAGDEIAEQPYWQRQDPNRPVSLVPLARYVGRESGDDFWPRIGWYAQGAPGAPQYLYTFPGAGSGGGQNNGYGQNQMLLPTATAGTGLNPSGPFGLVLEGVDGSPNSYSDDALNAEGGPHNYRFYPARDGAGTPIDGVYIVAFDFLFPSDAPHKNWDFQDYVFLMSNVVPAP